jgi:hypothetical protein
MNEKPPVTRNMRIAQWAIQILLIAILAVCSYGPIQKQVRAAELTSAIGGYKQVYTALFSYAKDHDGLYPTDLESESPTAVACFNKLLKAGVIDDEETFWSKRNAKVIGTASTSSPNNNRPLTENENTAGYVMGLSTRSPTNLPILFDSSTEAGVFNANVWEGKAIVAKLNGSVKAMYISLFDHSVYNRNRGYILERRGDVFIDIFKKLPEGTTVLPPQLAQ